MVDKIADSMEQSLFEQQFPQWFVAMTVVALITCMAAPHLCLGGLTWCWSVKRGWEGGGGVGGLRGYPENERMD